MMMRLTCGLLMLLCTSACAPTGNVADNLEVEHLSTGWLAAGSVNGSNKIVPQLSFTLRNKSDQKLPSPQLNAVFRRTNQTEEWGNGFRALSSPGTLAPGASTATVAIDAPLGYTGTDPVEHCCNSQFVGRQGRSFCSLRIANWTRLGEYPIERRLITSQ